MKYIKPNLDCNLIKHENSEKKLVTEIVSNKIQWTETKEPSYSKVNPSPTSTKTSSKKVSKTTSLT